MSHNWNELRANILLAELDRKSLSSAISQEETKVTLKDSVTALTGYACEGSWLMGVDANARSPVLAARVLSEAATLRSSKERAELGAGIPARKDFYDEFGDTAVPYLNEPALTWRRLLDFCGARARRRDRVVSANVRMSAVIEEIDHQIHHSLLVAEQRRDDYRHVGKKTNVIEEVSRVAADAVAALVEMIRSLEKVS